MGSKNKNKYTYSIRVLRGVQASKARLAVQLLCRYASAPLISTTVAEEIMSARRLAASLQDARHVIHTITFFAVSCPENSAFFPKKSANFRENSKKNIAHFENLRNMLHFGKIPKKFGRIWRKFSKILAKFANFWKKNSKKFQQFLTKILRLESGAKECIV